MLNVEKQNRRLRIHTGVKPIIIPIFDQDSLQKSLKRGLIELSSTVKIVIVTSKNQSVFKSMMNEPEPYGEPGYFRPKIIINQNCQIVKKVSEICKHFAENHSTNYVCYTNKMQDGDINTFITDTSKKKWIIVTDEILSQGMEAASVLYGMVQNTKEIWISPRFYAKNFLHMIICHPSPICN